MLGTLHEYRKTEVVQIADCEEGRLSFRLQFDGEVIVPVTWFNAMLGGSVYYGGGAEVEDPTDVFLGGVEVDIIDLTHKRINNNEVVISNSLVEIVRDAPNAFAFCMSAIRKMADCVGIFPDYDDYWNVTQGGAKKFGLRLGWLLMERIKNDHAKGVFLVPEDTCMEDLRVYLSRRDVVYMDREVHIRSGGDLTLEDFMSRMDNMAFIKPPSFSREKEFRFHYTIVSRDMVIEPLVNKLILDARSLVPWVL